jgi:hypothetical protein
MITLQTVLVVIAVAGAATYVIRGFLPRKNRSAGCDSCPANRNRKDDYA